jgi:hypothetical protein
MSQQADMILQFAHHLQKMYSNKGLNNVSIYADSYASLNGRGSQVYIDPKVDLTKVEDGLFTHKNWITKLEDK